MTQQINLLNPALLKKRELLSAANILAVYGFLLVSILTYGSYEYHAYHQAELEAKVSTQALTEVQTLLTQMRTNAAKDPKKQQLLNKIESLEHKQAMQEAILEAARHDESHKGESYATLLKAFARQSMNGLWITALNIDQDAQHLSISGRTLNPDLVPAYISKLRTEPALRGKSFTDLKMQYHETKAVVVNADDKQTTLNTEKTNTSVVKEQGSVEPLAYIEFTLQSSPDLDANNTENAMNHSAKVVGVR